LLTRFPKLWKTTYEVQESDDPITAELSAEELQKLLNNGTVLKVILQVMKNKEKTASQEDIDRNKVITRLAFE